MTTPRALPLLVLACGLASCAGSSLHAANRERLDTARRAIEAQSFRAAVATSEDLLADTREDANTYRLQRYYAAHLISQAHAEAAFSKPYFEEPIVGPQFRLDGPPTSRRPSSIAHLIAACWWADWTRQWFAALGDAPREVRGEPVLPAELSALGERNVLAHANLLTLAVYCRLDFQDKVADIVGGIPELKRLESCAELLAASGVPRTTHAWIYAGVFEQLCEEDHREAYRFGIRARLAAADSGGSFGSAHRKAIADWIQNDADFVFRSPSGSVFDPNLDGCTIDGTPNLEYIAVRKPPKSAQPPSGE